MKVGAYAHLLSHNLCGRMSSKMQKCIFHTKYKKTQRNNMSHTNKYEHTKMAKQKKTEKQKKTTQKTVEQKLYPAKQGILLRINSKHTFYKTL